MKIFVMAKTIIRNILQGPATLMYPKRKRAYTKITRGSIENEIEKCIFCGLCAKRCPTYAIAVSKENKEWVVDRLKCCVCNLCVEICPVKCLSTHNQYFSPVTGNKAGICTMCTEAPVSIPARE
jgi:formate hydrogenlyase subunit 6/NADH:ubiquinone oxidoreductase subunit I